LEEVEIIKPKKNKFDRKSGKELAIIRVAPYCRVSADSAEQLASYDLQVKYYEQKVISLDSTIYVIQRQAKDIRDRL